MATFYNDEIRIRIRDAKWPKGFVITPVSYADHLGLVIYADNIDTMDKLDLNQIESEINKVVPWIRNKGVPCYLEVRQYAPKS